MFNLKEIVQILNPKINNRKVNAVGLIIFFLGVLKYIFQLHFSDNRIADALVIMKPIIGLQCLVDNPGYNEELISIKLNNIIHYQIQYLVVTQLFALVSASIISGLILWNKKLRVKFFHLKTIVKYTFIANVLIYSAYILFPEKTNLTFKILVVLVLIAPAVCFYVFKNLLLKHYPVKELWTRTSIAVVIGLLLASSIYFYGNPLLYKKVLIPFIVKKECGNSTKRLVTNLLKIEDKVTDPKISQKIRALNQIAGKNIFKQFMIDKERFEPLFYEKLEKYSKAIKQLDELTDKAYRVLQGNSNLKESIEVTSKMKTDSEVRNYYKKNPGKEAELIKLRNDLFTFFKSNKKEYDLVKNSKEQFDSDVTFKNELKDYNKIMGKYFKNNSFVSDLAIMNKLKNEVSIESDLFKIVQELPKEESKTDEKFEANKLLNPKQFKK